MAETENEDRTEQASEKRLQEAREKGEIPRSRDLSGAMVVLAGASMLLSGSSTIYAHLQRIYVLGFGYSREALFSDHLTTRVLGEATGEVLALLIPIFAATLAAAVGSSVLIGGFNFSSEALVPNFERLDPIAGFGRLFALNGLIELAKSLLKILFIGSALVLLLRHDEASVMATGREAVSAGVQQSLLLVAHAALLFAVVLGVIGGLDAIWQRFDYERRHRMSKQELKDEHKDTDGNPQLKGRIRQMQQQLARRRMIQEVPKADVVVVNPTHFAVALRYDDKRMRAPRVVAKGVDVLAQQIRMVADAHRIPMVEAPPLARALYATTDLGHEIPAALYVAVAQILAYVYQLKQATEHGGPEPTAPKPDIDPELQGRYRQP
ncbi:flagellar biosynthesis protein FlhB [Dyella caseinilytica]|uniref:Flagellar biosynthetic protein FlhB n=1 Tax=Dyella caseinilytica TaxID=1849581 RepID=A0ABX7GSH3_9GAMM|nr:flagellar biosynthesis protein FlhB [Dyella caseinilytica]QRN53393.1 flagellar biosynthesis protein FlhB [Dyella caseinilytica]GFZ86155.1 flagellar biosynthesis protein FlhB [Dyella caseinilytica]